VAEWHHKVRMRQMTLGDLAERIGGRVDGDGSVLITGVAGVLEAVSGDISFVDNPKYAAYVGGCRASALIVENHLETDFRPLIRTENPYLAFTQAIELLAERQNRPDPGIHPSAVVHSKARVSPLAAVMANVVIDEEAEVGQGVTLYPGVVVGKGCSIDKDVLIYPNVTLYPATRIGARSIIHSGVTLGALPGKGEAKKETPSTVVEIEDDVEIGSNSAVMGGKQRATRIGRGTKIDNLVHIDHDAWIGSDSVIVAMVTIEPEVEIGCGVTIAGQVGVRRGVKIGDGSMIGARSVVTGDVPPGRIYSGSPAIAHDQ